MTNFNPSRRSLIARAIWDAMVNDEPPDDETLEREGFFDAADAAIHQVGLMADCYREALEQLHHLVVSPGDMGREDIRDAGRRVIEEALRDAG